MICRMLVSIDLVSESCSHTRTRHRATSASSLQRCSGSTTLSCRIATGNMYLASPRPWGINTRGGREILHEEVGVRSEEGVPFIGEGGTPRGWPAHGAAP